MGNANSEIEGLKISSSHRGCGQSFKMSLIEKGTSDIKSMECVSQKGVKIYLDNKVLLSIIGTQLDYKEDRISSQFIFKNSNIDSVCGCGATFVPKKWFDEFKKFWFDNELLSQYHYLDQNKKADSFIILSITLIFRDENHFQIKKITYKLWK